MNHHSVRSYATLGAVARKQVFRALRVLRLPVAIASGFYVNLVLAQGPLVNPPLHIDIPTTLENANVVIDYGHAVLNGDLPFGLADTNFLITDLREWQTKGQVIVVFHGDAAYLILNDETYNANRHVSTGNPYKSVLNTLMADGVQLELCGATAKGNHWGNANLLPGVKVNVNAMVRLTQLEEEGYSMIYQ